MRILKLLIILFVLGACNTQQESLNKEEFAAFLKDDSNGLIHSFENEFFKAEVIFKPSVLQALPDITRGKLTNRDSILNAYNKYSYIVIQLTGNGTLRDDFNQRIQEFTSNQSGYLNGVEALDIYYEDTYHLYGGVNILCVFINDGVLDTDMRFDVDMTPFGLGNKTIKWSKKDIHDIPELKLS